MKGLEQFAKGTWGAKPGSRTDRCLAQMTGTGSLGMGPRPKKIMKSSLHSNRSIGFPSCVLPEFFWSPSHVPHSCSNKVRKGGCPRPIRG